MLIQPYQAHWPEDFNSIKTILAESISIDDLEIEHIGSTAVKGLAAKPIIDMDIVYQNPASFKDIKTGLEELGYYHNGDQGIPGREVFKRRKEEERHPVLDAIPHHLYVCHSSSEELHRHLSFRDYLREHDAARFAYAKLKYEIAVQTDQDRKAYAELKQVMAREFVESIIERSTQAPKNP